MKKLAFTLTICLFSIITFAQQLDAIMISESIYLSIDESRHSKYMLACVDYESESSDKITGICLGNTKKTVSVNLLKIGKAIEQAQANCTESNKIGLSKKIKDDCSSTYTVQATKANDTFSYAFRFNSGNATCIDFDPEALQKILDIFE